MIQEFNATQTSRRRGLDGESRWRDFLAESGDLQEGEAEAQASRRVAAESIERLPSRIEERLR
jgi:hypothetical protein